MFIKKNGVVSSRLDDDFGHLITQLDTYEMKLAKVLHEFDVRSWYYDADYIIPVMFFNSLEQYLNLPDDYLFVRHESVSAKDIMDITIFEKSKTGYEYCMNMYSISPRVQESIRLNKLIDKDYTSMYCARRIIPIDVEYRVLIVDGITKWIIPDVIDRGNEHHEIIKNVVKKFKTKYHYDNYCIDVAISNNKAYVMELNPLLMYITDLHPYEDLIDLMNLDLPGNV